MRVFTRESEIKLMPSRRVAFIKYERCRHIEVRIVVRIRGLEE